MKLQYLGDSKDSFKWDYHDCLASTLSVQRLTVALMLTPDDNTGHGKTKAEWFPARPSVLRFCRDLQTTRDIGRIVELPAYTGAGYEVVLHQGAAPATSRTRYFSGFDGSTDQVVFIDPDTGFEPETSCDGSHVGYGDVHRVLAQLNGNSIVSVFQHYRRKAFLADFARIRERLGASHATALYWHSLMFVGVGRSPEAVDRVRRANRDYAKGKEVMVLEGG